MGAGKRLINLAAFFIEQEIPQNLTKTLTFDISIGHIEKVSLTFKMTYLVGFGSTLHLDSFKYGRFVGGEIMLNPSDGVNCQ